MGQGGAFSRRNDGRKRHGFRPGLAGRVLHFGRDFRFFTAGANHFKRPLEKAGAQQDCRSNALNFLRILHHARALYQVWRFAQTEARWQTGSEAVSRRYGHVLAFNPHPEGSRSVLRDLLLATCRSATQRLPPSAPCPTDDDLCALHFRSCLVGVSAVGKEHALGFGQKQHAGAAAEIRKDRECWEDG